jgi:glycosyltransferase involved in cell wall biosynthesis
MKVLMFGWEFPPHISGGLGTACFGLTKGMAFNNIEVIFVVPKAFGDEDQRAVRIVSADQQTINLFDAQFQEYWKHLTYLEVSSLLVPYMSPEEFRRLTDVSEHDYTDIKESVFAENFTFTGAYGPDLFKEVSRYALVATKIAKEYTHDIIHAHDWLTFPAGVAAKHASGKPLFVHVHATEFDRSGEHINPQVYEIERQGMLFADRVIAVSNRTRQVIIDKYGIAPEKVVTLHNAVTMGVTQYDRDANPLDDKIVTFLGRITFQKGPEYFVEAAKKVLDVDPNIRFVMAGTGDMWQRMVELVAKLRIGHKFHFAGFLNGAEVKKMFDMSSVYVMPSVSEPFGISPLEAMQSNVPVIISRQSGVSEVLNHAIKVDFWDIDAMADAIYALLHYQGISKMFARMGHEEVENLKWDNVAFKLKEIYQAVLDARS